MLVQPGIRIIWKNGHCPIQLFVTWQLSNYSNKHVWLVFVPLEMLVFAYFPFM